MTIKKPEKHRCLHCKRRVRPVKDLCHGCGRCVCVMCIFKFGHINDGPHGAGKR